MEPSRPAATPLKTGAGTPVAGGGEPPYDGNMEHRISTLEARWDAVIPTLATKADLVALGTALRAELHDGLHQNSMTNSALRADMQQSFGELRMDTQQSFDELRMDTQQSFDAVRMDTQQSFGTIRAEMQQSFGTIRAEMQQSFSELRAEMQHSLGELRGEMQKGFGELRTEMQKLSADNKTWMLATVLTIIGTMLAAIIGISQVQKTAAPAPIIITLPAAR